MKYYCWYDRAGKFHADENYIEDNPFEAFYIDTFDVDNKTQAEIKSKAIMVKRFKAI